MSDFHGKEDKSTVSFLSKLALPLFFGLLLFFFVVVDFSFIIMKVREIPFFNKKESHTTDPTQGNDEKDFVFDAEDLQRASRNIFEEQRKRIEEGAGKEALVKPVYLIELASGKSFLATVVQTHKGVVTLYDERGYKTVLAKKDIVTIKKIAP